MPLRSSAFRAFSPITSLLYNTDARREGRKTLSVKPFGDEFDKEQKNG
jgi:hypothetical protein